MRSLRIASVQLEPRPLDVAWNLGRIDELAREAAGAGAEVVAFPECSVTSYMPLGALDAEGIAAVAEPVPGGPSCRRLLDIARRCRAAVGAGLLERDAEGRVYNAYVVATPEGEAHVARKLHPFVSPHLSPGDVHAVFDYGSFRFGVLVCYDNNQPENGRVLATRGVEILLAPHQTGGFPVRYAGMGLVDPGLWARRHEDPEPARAELRGPKGREWLMRWLPSRAYDNGCYVVFSNGIGRDGDEIRTGNAMILDPHGRVLAESDALADDVVVADAVDEPLRRCLGRTHLRSRRPELYAALAAPAPGGLDTKAARDQALEDVGEG